MTITDIDSYVDSFLLFRISVVLEGEEAGINEGTQEAAETERSVGTPLGQGKAHGGYVAI